MPAALIPYEMHSVGRVGHDLLAGAVTLGFESVFVLMDPRKGPEYASLHQQVELADMRPRVVLVAHRVHRPDPYVLAAPQQEHLMNFPIWLYFLMEVSFLTGLNI